MHKYEQQKKIFNLIIIKQGLKTLNQKCKFEIKISNSIAHL